jgi:hypothetical protein
MAISSLIVTRYIPGTHTVCVKSETNYVCDIKGISTTI